MTNFQRWQELFKGLESPQIYVDFGFHFTIAAALQRRVWIGPEHMQLYPNLYVMFVGNPGIGKGIMRNQISALLKHHKLRPPGQLNGKLENIKAVDRELVEAVAAADYAAAKQESERGQSEGRQAAFEKPLLFPMAADATTYEALVSSMARAVRRIDYEEYDEKLQRNIRKIYTHSTQCFCLEELSSLLRRHTEDTVQFLMVGYDCGDYKKDTKTGGVDRVNKMCVNFLACTTPSFMQRTFTDGLLNEGFSSRTLFLYASKNRFTKLFYDDFTAEQKQYRAEILQHIEKLSQMYGRIFLDDDAKEYLEDWWKKQQEERINMSSKLIHYYARKKVHALKLATAVHFGESFTMNINLKECQTSVAMLDQAEVLMHHALVHESSNPMYRPAQKIVAFLEENGPRNKKELLAKFYEDVDMKQLDDILTHMIIMGKIVIVGQEKYAAVKEVRL